MSRTVIRGLSDAYGSWKTIWMSRRTGRICLRLKLVMSVPSKTIGPAVGSISLMIVRPSVVFPQPDSPTTPSVSPARTLRIDAVDRTHLPDGVLEDAGLDREVLDEALDAEESCRSTPAAGDARVGSRASVVAHRRPRLPARDGRPHARELFREVARRAVTCAARRSPRSSGISVRHTRPALRVRRSAGGTRIRAAG